MTKELKQKALAKIAAEESNTYEHYACGVWCSHYNECFIPGFGDCSVVNIYHRDDSSPAIVVPEAMIEEYTDGVYYAIVEDSSGKDTEIEAMSDD